MSEYSPGTFQFAERIMDLSVQEAHRGAEAQRLQRQAKAGREGSLRLYSGAMAWLGHRLSTWGERLQERYSPEGSAPVAQSAKGLAS